MALEIYIEDVAIPISDDFTLSLTYLNPLFTEKKINEIYSYSFSIQASPVLNNLLTNSKRVDASSRNFLLNVRMKMDGVVMIQGKMNLSKTSNSYYSCNAYNNGRDLFKVTSDKHISEYDYGKIELWSELEDITLSDSDKINRWSEHFGEINDQDSTVGAYKFPMIKAYYDNPEDEENKVKDDGLNYVFWKGGGVNVGFWDPYNPLLTGVGAKNKAIPNTEFPQQTNWLNTYSPCLRLEHMFTTMLNDFNLVINENQLKDINEFKNLTVFSSYVCDENNTGFAQYINVHGRAYDLSDFTPNTSAWQLFRTLTELFNAVFLIGNNETIDIVLSKDILSAEAIDFTSKTNPETIINKNEGKHGLNYFYDIEKEDLRIINDEHVGGWSMENSSFWMYKPVGEKQEEGFAIEHMPLRTLLAQPRHYFNLLNFYSSWDEYTSQCSGIWDNLYLSFAFMKPRGAFGLNGNWLNKDEQLMLSSREFPEDNGKPERFNLLLFYGRKLSKGYYTDINPDGSCNIQAPGGPFFDVGVYLTCNLERTDDMNINGYDVNHPNITVSEKHLYLNEKINDQGKGTYDNYHRPLAEFEEFTEEIQKTLYLMPHEVNELSMFRNPKHRINSPEGSFEGIIKEFKVQLTKYSISPTTATYLKQIYEE